MVDLVKALFIWIQANNQKTKNYFSYTPGQLSYTHLAFFIDNKIVNLNF